MKKCFGPAPDAASGVGTGPPQPLLWRERRPPRPSITVDGQTYEDITEVPITKLYQLVNDGTVSPAETFRFSIGGGTA